MSITLAPTTTSTSNLVINIQARIGRIDFYYGDRGVQSFFRTSEKHGVIAPAHTQKTYNDNMFFELKSFEDMHGLHFTNNYIEGINESFPISTVCKMPNNKFKVYIQNKMMLLESCVELQGVSVKDYVTSVYNWRVNKLINALKKFDGYNSYDASCLNEKKMELVRVLRDAEFGYIL